MHTSRPRAFVGIKSGRAIEHKLPRSSGAQDRVSVLVSLPVRSSQSLNPQTWDACLHPAPIHQGEVIVCIGWRKPLHEVGVSRCTGTIEFPVLHVELNVFGFASLKDKPLAAIVAAILLYEEYVPQCLRVEYGG